MSAAPMAAEVTVPVYEWTDNDRRWLGQGTRAEFDYWRAEGVVPDDAVLSKVIGHEPASEDDRRAMAWAA